eukprot:364340-Chlamydomonas_euryale.AAC.6
MHAPARLLGDAGAAHLAGILAAWSVRGVGSFRWLGGLRRCSAAAAAAAAAAVRCADAANGGRKGSPRGHGKTLVLVGERSTELRRAWVERPGSSTYSAAVRCVWGGAGVQSRREWRPGRARVRRRRTPHPGRKAPTRRRFEQPTPQPPFATEALSLKPAQPADATDGGRAQWSSCGAGDALRATSRFGARRGQPRPIPLTRLDKRVWPASALACVLPRPGKNELLERPSLPRACALTADAVAKGCDAEEGSADGAGDADVRNNHWRRRGSTVARAGGQAEQSMTLLASGSSAASMLPPPDATSPSQHV